MNIMFIVAYPISSDNQFFRYTYPTAAGLDFHAAPTLP
jgi:hypothetical protein